MSLPTAVPEPYNALFIAVQRIAKQYQGVAFAGAYHSEVSIFKPEKYIDSQVALSGLKIVCFGSAGEVFSPVYGLDAWRYYYQGAAPTLIYHSGK